MQGEERKEGRERVRVRTEGGPGWWEIGIELAEEAGMREGRLSFLVRAKGDLRGKYHRAWLLQDSGYHSGYNSATAF